MADTKTNYVGTLYAVSWGLGSLVIVVCSARVYGRAFVTHQIGWDDFFMVFGAISAIICSSLVTVGASHGLGKHEHDIESPHLLSEAIKYTIIAPVLSLTSSTSSKVSIFIFLIRLMGVTAKRWHLCFLWGLCVLLGLLNLFAIVLILRFCSPTAYQWDKTLDGTCMNPNIQYYGSIVGASYTALVDIILAIFPTTFITKLNISRKMKVGLCFLMGGSVFAAVATIVKVYLLKDLDQHQDITWFWAPITLWYT
ncbi:hypothetical protein F4820DRAFT_465718 [Hypoxylon rubiginosum]|uniref:Uncharacterized protein n=1 Tax=Hypoxylon rubiginosum TaxID=110542 RepID=A0ACB9YLT6_9PEZI|nr:hypothetical protein F4820DRAFT_465718 [Hypoxylon rubiginosum]